MRSPIQTCLLVLTSVLVFGCSARDAVQAIATRCYEKAKSVNISTDSNFHIPIVNSQMGIAFKQRSQAELKDSTSSGQITV
jgi:type IV pilus biogenesis protein CpaD/CtpE